MFIPPSVTPIVTVPPRHVREMQKRVEQLLREFRRDNPELSDEQIREALRIILTSSSPGTRPQVAARLAAIVAAALGIVVLGGVFALGADRGGVNGVWAPVAVAILGAVVAAVVALRLRSGR